MSSLFLILSSIIFPILTIAWLACMAFCIYKALIRHLERPGRNTKVQVQYYMKRHLVFLPLVQTLIHSFMKHSAAHCLKITQS